MILFVHAQRNPGNMLVRDGEQQIELARELTRVVDRQQKLKRGLATEWTLDGAADDGNAAQP